jgi:hypothetical protein
MLENLQLNSFSELVKTTFIVHADGDVIVQLELDEAKDLGSNPRQDRFALLFRGPLDVALEQRTYRIDHARLGSFELFLVPVGVVESGRQYEAIFNRLIR